MYKKQKILVHRGGKITNKSYVLYGGLRVTYTFVNLFHAHNVRLRLRALQEVLYLHEAMSCVEHKYAECDKSYKF